MLYWENEFPDYGVVHHLMVLCYHLQHPHKYSPEALVWGIKVLADFVERGTSLEDIRQRSRKTMDSGTRRFRIAGRSDHYGAYAKPVRWTMTAADVVANGAAQYIESVREWARVTLAAIKESGNFPAT
jgi:hypothetical protein